MSDLTIIGGGLAGAEAAWQAAETGVHVTLFEMRPARSTGAHRTDLLAELVCSNSLGSQLPDRASGILQDELRVLGSLLMRCAREVAVPAGSALAVDRALFAEAVTAAITAHPRITLRREEAGDIPPGPAVIAAGPLVSPSLASRLAQITGEGNLYFFDAIAPVIWAETIDFSIVFRGARHHMEETEGGDYINCPFTREAYEQFIAELRAAQRAPLRAFESDIDRGAPTAGYFEGCLPIEVLAARHPDAPAYGPMRPVGLIDPRTGRRPYAVAQLRQEDLAGDRYNLVGFQTNLTEAEQRRVFRLIPGLARAEFDRYGQMHRNTYLNAPRVLKPTLQWRAREDVFFAGQMAGVEGYAGAIATGWLAGINAARCLCGETPIVPPAETMLGALCRALAEGDPSRFQPVKASLGLLPPLPSGNRLRQGRRARAAAFAQRARAAMAEWPRLMCGSSALL